MEHPESLTSDDFPPIQVIGDGLKDGAHRISTLNALAKHIDPDNPYWKEVKLEVRFYQPEIVKDIGPTWVNGKLVYNTDEGLQSKSIVDTIPFLNLNEHQETRLNPELEVGDIIKVISVDGEHARMPQLFDDYKVVKTRDAKMDTLTSEYYDIVPYPSPHAENYDYNSSSYSHTRWNEHVKTLYRGDKWIRIWKEEIPEYIEEQKSFMDNSDQAMERARKEALRRGLLNSLDMLFEVLPYEEGEIVHNDVNMGIYHKETGQFVPIDYVYDPIMENMGMEVTEADLQLFIDIITEWVNMSMVPDSAEEYVN
jgi:predicted RNA-binding protein